MLQSDNMQHATVDSIASACKLICRTRGRSGTHVKHLGAVVASENDRAREREEGCHKRSEAVTRAFLGTVSGTTSYCTVSPCEERS